MLNKCSVYECEICVNTICCENRLTCGSCDRIICRYCVNLLCEICYEGICIKCRTFQCQKCSNFHCFYCVHKNRKNAKLVECVRCYEPKLANDCVICTKRQSSNICTKCCNLTCMFCSRNCIETHTNCIPLKIRVITGLIPNCIVEDIISLYDNTSEPYIP